ncbi:MAG: hypothetical protein KDD66_07535 [Bdellovibrionales bacterium]|nr:hypothetical protein [Bdellovibrionales bacterium]
MLTRISTFAAALLVAGTAHAQSFNAGVKADPVQSYWSQYGVPDPGLNVYAALDYNGEFVFNGVIGDHSYELMWFSDGVSGQFQILIDNKVWVGDLLTSQDDGFRPTFSGLFDGIGEASIHGFVDVSPEGFLVVQFSAPGADTQRFLVNSGDTVAAATCVCFGTAQNKKDCSDSDCDVSEQCHGSGDPVGSAHCRWKAGQVAQAQVLR